MDIQDVQNVQGYERRSIRINIRITSSQNKFIINEIKMNKELVPKDLRMLMWVIAIAIMALIALTGYISIQVAGIEQEVQELRQTA